MPLKRDSFHFSFVLDCGAVCNDCVCYFESSVAMNVALQNLQTTGPYLRTLGW